MSVNLERRIIRLKLKIRQTNPMTGHVSDTGKRIANTGFGSVAVGESPRSRGKHVVETICELKL